MYMYTKHHILADFHVNIAYHGLGKFIVDVKIFHGKKYFIDNKF